MGQCRRSGNGGPQTCLPAACGVARRGATTAHLHQHRPKTLARGQASRGGRRGASSGAASSGWLTWRQRNQGGVPHEVPMTQAMTTKGAGLRSVLLSSLVQREHAQARASSKGVHFGATRPRPVQRYDGGHRGAQAGVTTRALLQAKTTFVRIACTSCPLSNCLPLLAPLLLNIWEEDQGLYK